MRWSRKRASSPDFTPHITASSYPTCFPHIFPLFPLPCTSWRCRELFLCFFILCKQSQPPLSLPAPGSSTPLKISLVQNLQTYKIHLFFFSPDFSDPAEERRPRGDGTPQLLQRQTPGQRPAAGGDQERGHFLTHPQGKTRDCFIYFFFLTKTWKQRISGSILRVFKVCTEYTCKFSCHSLEIRCYLHGKSSVSQKSVKNSYFHITNQVNSAFLLPF